MRIYFDVILMLLIFSWHILTSSTHYLPFYTNFYPSFVNSNFCLYLLYLNMDASPPAMPKKLRPFKAMVSPSNQHRSISPPPDIDIGVNSTPLPRSSGMFLLIHNMLPDNKTGFGDPVILVKKALMDIISTDDGKELADIDLVIIAGGQLQDHHSASAYLKLAKQVKILNSLP
jgi:hypothetical protein